jgi:hypothetical protein
MCKLGAPRRRFAAHSTDLAMNMVRDQNDHCKDYSQSLSQNSLIHAILW